MCPFAMFLFSLLPLSLLPLFITPCISRPSNISYLQLPSTSLRPKVIPDDPASDWPTPPWIVNTGEISIQFETYGRIAHPILREQIVDATRGLQDYFAAQRFIGPEPMNFRRGIITFTIGFSERVPIVGMNLAVVLAVVNTLYSDRMISIPEITSAQIKLRVARVPIVAFQVRFAVV